ncbi:MAG TPA: hypothetical protein VNP72_07075 [Longimicrobium sp.]|nr:hypothetical protein [Longimicrobium sp.]
MDVIAMIGSWIEAWMNQRGGGNNWDWNGSNSTFAGYTADYGLKIATTISYGAVSSSTTQVTANTASYGPIPVDTAVTFDHSYPSADEFTWTLSQVLSTTASPSVNAGVPAVFPAEAGTTFPVDLTVTQAQTAAEGNLWTQSAPFMLPAGQVVTVSMIVSETAASADALVTAVVSGSVAAGLNSPWNGHYFWFIPIAQLAQEFNTDPQVTVVGANVQFSVPASFTGHAVVGSHLLFGSSAGPGSPLTGSRGFITHPAALLGRSPTT